MAFAPLSPGGDATWKVNKLLFPDPVRPRHKRLKLWHFDLFTNWNTMERALRHSGFVARAEKKNRKLLMTFWAALQFDPRWQDVYADRPGCEVRPQRRWTCFAAALWTLGGSCVLERSDGGGEIVWRAVVLITEPIRHLIRMLMKHGRGCCYHVEPDLLVNHFHFYLRQHIGAGVPVLQSMWRFITIVMAVTRLYFKIECKHLTVSASQM